MAAETLKRRVFVVSSTLATKRLQKRRKTKRFWVWDIFKERRSQGDF